MAAIALPAAVFTLLGPLLPLCTRRAGSAFARSRGAVASAAPSGGSVGVIGGGVAGVTAARVLAEHGVEVVLHERERTLGGRLAPTACSYIKGKDPTFIEQLESWRRDGLVAEWATATPHLISTPGVWVPLADGGQERWFVGVPHMGSPAALSEVEHEYSSRISIHGGHEVFDVNFEGNSWVVASTRSDAAAQPQIPLEEDTALTSHIHSELIVATPVHEASTFLERKVLDKALGRARYKDFVKERVSASFVFESSLGLPFNFCAMTYEGAPATVAICETSRCAAGQPAGGEGDGDGNGSETWIVQSDTRWASTALEEEWEPSAMEEGLLHAFATALGRSELPDVRESTVVVWPYGDMDYGLEGGYAWVDDLRLAMAGDWAYNGRVEGAWLSGRAAALRVLADRRERATSE